MTTRIRLLPGRFALSGSPLDLGSAVMFATIENGVVTAIAYGALPESDDDTLYLDLSRYEPPPLVGWYFSDVCQTFSETPPVIPAGDVAPPFTPGGLPPIPGTPEFPVPEVPEIDDQPALATLTQSFLSFHADGDAQLVASGASGGGDLVELDPRMRTVVRLRDICGIRLQAHVVSGGAVDLVLAYRNEDDEWEALSPLKTGPRVSCVAEGTYAGLFTNVDPIALDSSNVVTVCVRGEGSAVVGNVLALLLIKANAGACPVFAEDPAGCEISGTIAEENIERFEFASYAAFWSAADNGERRFSYTDLPSSEGAVGGLEAAPTLDESPTLRQTYRVIDSPAPSNLVLAFSPVSGGGMHRRAAIVWEGRIPSAFVAATDNGNPLGPTDYFSGIGILSIAGGAYNLLTIRNGTLYLEDNAGTSTVVTSLAAIADRDIRIVLAGTDDRAVGPGFGAACTIADACSPFEDPPTFASITTSASGAPADFTFAAILPIVNADITEDASLLTYRVYFVDDLELVGLGNPGEPI